MTVLVQIFFIGATILMIYELIRIVLVNITKLKGIKSDKEELKNAEERIIMWRKEHANVVAKYDNTTARLIESRQECLKLTKENEELKTGNVKAITQLQEEHDRLFNMYLEENGEVVAAKDRIVELEAALARAEAVNRSYAKPFADGGLVNTSEPAII